MNYLSPSFDTLILSPSYWSTHLLLLALSWFVLSPLAVFLCLSLPSSSPLLTKPLRFTLYFFLYLISFSLLYASLTRLAPIFYRFDSWPFGRRVMLLAGNCWRI